MKKSLLFVLIASLIGLSAYTQQLVKPGKAYETAQRVAVERISMEPESSNDAAILPDYNPRSHKGSNAAVKKVLIGTSRNAFTLILQQQSCMVYNKDLDAIMGIYRGNDKALGTLPVLGTGNTICTFLSTDGGTTFTGNVTLNITGMALRYPSGVIYNPVGNTTKNEAFSVLAGPITEASVWSKTYLSSMKFSGTNQNIQQVPTSDLTETYMGNMAACSDGSIHIEDLKNNADGTVAIGIVKNGKFNATALAFDWAEVEVQLPLYKKPSDGTLNVDYGPGNMAWNKSGSVGYLMYVGVDSTATGKKGRYPIVFKSVNQGATWTKMPYFDFSTFPEVKDRIFSTGTLETDPVVPWFWETDMVVDVNDNLHIMALCKGHSSTHGDSLNYYYPNEAGPIYEFSYERNQWLCHYIATPKTHEVVDAESPYLNAGAGLGWDMRLQASRTDDGKKVFAVWTDTDWQAWGQADSLNLNPDVMIWGRDVVTNKSTKVKNVTNLQEGWGECHWMFASPTVIDKAGVYTIPISISDIYASNLDALEPIPHYFLQGASLTDADFTIVGTKPNPKVEQLEVSSYPNPAINGKTNISVTLDRSAPVSVIINSVTGQQVRRVNYGTMNAGVQTLPVDVSNLKSGVYFYTVTIGNQKATNKMIIK